MQFVSEGESPWGCTADLLKWMNIPNANVSEKQIRFQPKVAVSVILILCRHIGAKYLFSTTRHLEHKILRYKTPVYQHFTTSHLEMKNWRQLFVLQACQQTHKYSKKITTCAFLEGHAFSCVTALLRFCSNFTSWPDYHSTTYADFFFFF